MAYKSKFMQKMEQQGKISAASGASEYKSKFMQSGKHLTIKTSQPVISATPAPMRSEAGKLTAPTAMKPVAEKPMETIKTPTELIHEMGGGLDGKYDVSVKPSSAYMTEVSGLQVQEAELKLNQSKAKLEAVRQQETALAEQNKKLSSAQQGMQQLMAQYQMTGDEVTGNAYLLAAEEYNKLLERYQKDYAAYEKDASVYDEYNTDLLKYQKAYAGYEKYAKEYNIERAEYLQEHPEVALQDASEREIQRTLDRLESEKSGLILTGKTVDWDAVENVNRKIDAVKQLQQKKRLSTDNGLWNSNPVDFIDRTLSAIQAGQTEWMAGMAQIEQKLSNAFLKIAGSQIAGMGMSMRDADMEAYGRKLMENSNQESADAAAARKASQDYMAEALSGTGKVDGWIVQKMQSVGSMMMDMMASGSTYAMGLPEGTDTRKIMAIRAGGSSMLQAQEEGKTETEQILMGIASGALEYASEGMFGGNPIYDVESGWVTDAVAKAIKNPKILKLMYSDGFGIFSEGLEETFVSFMEPVAEGLITLEKPEMATAAELADAFAGGVFLSLVGQGSSVMVREVSGAGRAERQAGRVIERSDAVQELVSEGLAAKPNTEAFKLATELQAKLDAGKKLSAAEIGRQLFANQEAIDAGLLVDDEMQPDREGPEGALQDPESGYYAIQTAEADGKQTYQLVEVREDGSIRKIGQTADDLMAAKRAAQAQGLNVRHIGKEDVLRDVAQSTMDQVNAADTESTAAVNAADNENTGLRWAGNEEGAYDYGTEQRNMGAGADQERIGGNADGYAANEQAAGQAGDLFRRTEAARRIRNYAETTINERTSLNELGLSVGNQSKNLRVLNRETDPDVAEAFDIAEKAGVNLVPVSGNMIVTENGEEFGVVGAVENGTIYARADSTKMSIREVVEHEIFHDKVAKNPKLRETLANWLYDTYGAAAVKERLDKYYEEYHGVYDKTATDEELEFLMIEELLADAYAEYSRFGEPLLTRLSEKAQEETSKAEGETAGQYTRFGLENDPYTYEALINKPDMVVTIVQNHDLPTKGKRYDTSSISAEARSKAITLENEDGFAQKYVHIKDLGANVLTPKDGFSHGITGNTTNGSATRTAEVTYDLTNILENSIAVNEESSRGEKDGLYSYILFGYAKRESDGKEYIVKTTVNHFGINKSIVDTVEIYDVLKGSKAKIVKPSVIGSHTGEPAASVLNASGSTTISVAELLETVKENYPEFLPNNVREHFGIEETPKAPNLRYSAEGKMEEERLEKDKKSFAKAAEARAEKIASGSRSGELADEILEKAPGSLIAAPHAVPRSDPKESIIAEKLTDEERAEVEKIMAERGTRPTIENPQTAEDWIIRKGDFTSTPAMDKLGIKIDGSVTRYRSTSTLRGYEEAAKQANRMLDKVIRKLKPTEQEKDFAKMLVKGTLTLDMLNASKVDLNKIAEIADYYMAKQSFNDDLIHQRKAEINVGNTQIARELLEDKEEYRPKLKGPLAPFTKMVMNERTPERVVKQIFGPEQGQKIYEALFRPVWVNGAEMYRFENRLLKQVETFTDKDGKKRKLTEKEREFAQRLMENKAVADEMQKLQESDRSKIEKAARELNENVNLTEVTTKYGLHEGYEQGLAQAYADYLYTVEVTADMDMTILENAIAVYRQIYNDMYEAYNDFLVSHGYPEIGFIKDYAPHFQKAEVRSGLTAALQALGVVNEKVSDLPVDIAGRTADFKPNSKWNPHAQQRRGSKTDYDIQAGFERYIHYAAEVFYHTDDVMRIRAASNWLRSQYSQENISEAIQEAQTDRYKSPEWKQNFLRRIGKLDPLKDFTPREINEAYEKYVDSLYKAAAEGQMTKYSEFVTWLDNYANIVAGKQSLADRGLEFGGGRTALNFGNKLMRAFSAANVAGNISSVLNQSAQLPLIYQRLGVFKPHIYKAAGQQLKIGAKKSVDYFKRAILHMERGDVAKDNFVERSDFLTDKRGVDKLTTDNIEKFISGLFKPAEMMDRMVSTLAVRGRYLQALDEGMTPEEAMKAADDFGRQIMGSRMKGARPQSFESKTFVNQMLHVFQTEASNVFDYMFLSDMPQAVRYVEKTKGKAAAARYTAAAAAVYLLGAFLLNTLTDELYGGSPAPFDLFGWALNFLAGGWDVDDEEYLKTVIDNGWEKLFGERLFDTERIDKEEGFQWAGAVSDVWYDVLGDVPYLRNAMGLAGVGDQSLPTVGVNEFFGGLWGAGKTLWNQAAKGQEETGLDWAGAAAEAAESLGNAIVQIAPGGRQISKSYQGIRAMLQGGKYSGRGENARLQYPVDQNAWNVIRASLFGLTALDETGEFYAGGKALTAAQTQKAKQLEEMGVGVEQIYDLYQGFSEINDDLNKERIGSIEAKQLKRDWIDNMDLTDEQKLEVYMQTVATGSDKAKEKTRAKYEALLGEGVKWSQITSLENDYASFNEDADGDGEADMDSLERGIAKRNAIAALDLTDEQKLEVFDRYHLDKEDKNYETTLDEFHAMLDAGLNWNDVTAAHNTYATLNADEEMNATQKATEYAKWADEQGWTNAQKSAIKDRYMFWQMIPAEATSYEKFTGAGLNSDNADKVTKLLADLEPEAGKDSVSTVQKLEAIANGGFASTDEAKAMRSVMTEEQAAEFDDLMDAGLTPKQYAQYRRAVYGLESDKDADGKTISGSKKKKVLEAVDRLPISAALKTELYYAEGYSKNTLDDAPWY